MFAPPPFGASLRLALRLCAPAALLALGLALSGCAEMTDSASLAFADPAKYDLYDCKQLENERKYLANRAAEFQGLMAKARKPANTAPGLIYMLEGGSDISATDPFATKTDHYISSPPHFMIMWPYDPKTSGFGTTPKKTGSWIMWAGTPYAHLMVNQTP